MNIMWILTHGLPAVCFILAVVVFVQTVIYIRSAFFGPKNSR